MFTTNNNYVLLLYLAICNIIPYNFNNPSVLGNIWEGNMYPSPDFYKIIIFIYINACCVHKRVVLWINKPITKFVMVPVIIVLIIPTGVDPFTINCEYCLTYFLNPLHLLMKNFRSVVHGNTRAPLSRRPSITTIVTDQTNITDPIWGLVVWHLWPQMRIVVINHTLFPSLKQMLPDDPSWMCHTRDHWLNHGHV